jgi:hypothetical protein
MLEQKNFVNNHALGKYFLLLFIIYLNFILTKKSNTNKRLGVITIIFNFFNKLLILNSLRKACANIASEYQRLESFKSSYLNYPLVLFIIALLSGFIYKTMLKSNAYTSIYPQIDISFRKISLVILVIV